MLAGGHPSCQNDLPAVGVNIGAKKGHTFTLDGLLNRYDQGLKMSGDSLPTRIRDQAIGAFELNESDTRLTVFGITSSAG